MTVRVPYLLIRRLEKYPKNTITIKTGWMLGTIEIKLNVNSF